MVFEFAPTISDNELREKTDGYINKLREICFMLENKEIKNKKIYLEDIINMFATLGHYIGCCEQRLFMGESKVLIELKNKLSELLTWGSYVTVCQSPF